MASFQEAIAKTVLWEGGYSNHPLDSGGETYKGISRKNWPTWKGWILIDEAKKGWAHVDSLPDFPACLERNSPLQGLVLDFYHKNFWQYDGLEDQDVAWKVFDLSVNVGKVPAIKILQKVVGTNIDGHYGPNTERLTNSHLKGSLTPLIKTAAIEYHKEIVDSHPEQAVFLKGWIRRDNA